MKEKYKKENLEKIVKESYCVADVIRALGMSPKGTNYETVKKYINLYNLNTDHFTGQAWNRDKSYTELTARVPLEDILKENVSYSSSTLLKRLVKSGMKLYKCEGCGCCDPDVSLELHHIDGDHYNNTFENLQVLCPNCHSKTPNYRSRAISNESMRKTGHRLGKRKELPTCICQNCNNSFKSDRHDRIRKFCCRDCYNEYLSKSKNLGIVTPLSQIPTKDTLIEACKQYTSLTDLGKHFGVSRTSVRNWLKTFDLLEDFKIKYDFHSKKVAQYDLNLKLIKEWPSITDASDSLQIDHNSISKCAKGTRRSAGGYIWKYIE